jgi:HD-GYP domain-containing protein (c-di-GMP phosphodiesterase class II)
MTCIDIYQAVCEERPYHPRRSHEETMPILRQMAEAGKIDASIVKDLDIMAAWSEKDMDAPRRWG